MELSETMPGWLYYLGLLVLVGVVAEGLANILLVANPPALTGVGPIMIGVSFIFLILYLLEKSSPRLPD